MRSWGWRLVALAFLVAVSVASSSPAADAASRPRVVVVLDPGACPEDDTRTLRLCEGFRRAVRRTGVDARIVAPTYREGLDDFLSLVARQGYEAVVTFGIGFTPELGAVAARYPNVPFVVLDVSRANVSGNPKNVQGIVLRTNEAAFLAGWLAAKLEARRPGPDVVGVVGGIKIPTVDDFVVGYTAGARRAVRGVKVLVDYSNDFVDPSKCAPLARRQFARGAGTIFNVAGACGLGTLEAAAKAGKWAIGVDADQSSFGPHVLTSVLKHFEAAFVEIFQQIKAGRVRTGRDTQLTMRDGAAGLGKISPKVPRALTKELESVRRKILAGEIRVPGVVRLAGQ
jgi:basic membrane protein A and related proteins